MHAKLHETVSCCTMIGNNTDVRLTSQVKRVQAHNAAVNQICFDEAAEYIASCSDDGSVAVSTASKLLRDHDCHLLLLVPLMQCPPLGGIFWMGELLT